MFLIYIIVASKINLFLFMSNKRDSPHKSIFLLTLPEKNSELSEPDFTLFLRSKRY